MICDAALTSKLRWWASLMTFVLQIVLLIISLQSYTLRASCNYPLQWKIIVHKV